MQFGKIILQHYVPKEGTLAYFFQKILKWLLWAHFWDYTADFFSTIAPDNSGSVAGFGNENFSKLWPRKNKFWFQKKCSKIFINWLEKLFLPSKWSSLKSGYADIVKNNYGSIFKEITQKFVIRHQNLVVTKVGIQKSSEFNEIW